MHIALFTFAHCYWGHSTSVWLKSGLGIWSAWALQKEVGRHASRRYSLEMLSQSKAKRDPGVLYDLAVSVTKGLPAQNNCLLARNG